MKMGPFRVWRIVRASIYAPDDRFVGDLSADLKAWSGGAAAMYPGRWNKSGCPVAYAAESQSLAAWEVFIHSSSVPQLIAHDKHRIVFATFDSGLVDTGSIVDVEVDKLPADWNVDVSLKKAAAPSSSQYLGHQLLIEGNALALRVPSVIIPGEFNYVINVQHRDFSRLKFSSPERFDFDGRLQRLLGITSPP